MFPSAANTNGQNEVVSGAVNAIFSSAVKGNVEDIMEDTDVIES